MVDTDTPEPRKTFPSPKSDESLPAHDNTSHLFLHASKLDKAAAFTLKMVEHACQTLELLATLAIRAMVNLLHMDRTLQMLIQARDALELPMA